MQNRYTNLSIPAHVTNKYIQNIKHNSAYINRMKIKWMQMNTNIEMQLDRSNKNQNKTTNIYLILGHWYSSIDNAVVDCHCLTKQWHVSLTCIKLYGQK